MTKVYFDITIHGDDRTVEQEFDLPDDLTQEEFHNALNEHLDNYLDSYVEESGTKEEDLFYSFGYTTEKDGVVWSL